MCRKSHWVNTMSGLPIYAIRPMENIMNNSKLTICFVILIAIFGARPKSSMGQAIDPDKDTRVIVRQLKEQIPEKHLNDFKLFIEKSLKVIHGAIDGGNLTQQGHEFILTSITDECVYLYRTYESFNTIDKLPFEYAKILSDYFDAHESSLRKINSSMVNKDWTRIREQFREDIKRVKAVAGRVIDSMPIILLDKHTSSHFKALIDCYGGIGRHQPGARAINKKFTGNLNMMFAEFTKRFLHSYIKHALYGECAQAAHYLHSVYRMVNIRYEPGMLSSKTDDMIKQEITKYYTINNAIIFVSLSDIFDWTRIVAMKVYNVPSSGKKAIKPLSEEQVLKAYNTIDTLASQHPSVFPVRLNNVPVDMYTGKYFEDHADLDSKDQPSGRHMSTIGKVKLQQYVKYWFMESTIIPTVEEDQEETRIVLLKETRDEYLQQLADRFYSKVVRIKRFGGDLDVTDVGFSEIEMLLYNALLEAIAFMDIKSLNEKTVSSEFQRYDNALADLRKRFAQLKATDRALDALKEHLEKILAAKIKTPEGRAEAQRVMFRDQLTVLKEMIDMTIGRYKNVDYSPTKKGMLSVTLRRLIAEMHPPADKKHQKVSRHPELASLLVAFYQETKDTNPVFQKDILAMTYEEQDPRFFKYKKEEMSKEGKRLYEKIIRRIASISDIHLPEKIEKWPNPYLQRSEK